MSHLHDTPAFAQTRHRLGTLFKAHGDKHRIPLLQRRSIVQSQVLQPDGRLCPFSFLVLSFSAPPCSPTPLAYPIKSLSISKTFNIEEKTGFAELGSISLGHSLDLHAVHCIALRPGPDTQDTTQCGKRLCFQSPKISPPGTRFLQGYFAGMKLVFHLLFPKDLIQIILASFPLHAPGYRKGRDEGEI